jgi:hypothetical protein
MKLKLMIALVIMALVFGMTFTACDDGDAPEIKYTYKDVSGTSVKTTTIYDDEFLRVDYDQNPKKGDGSANPDFGKYDPTTNPEKWDTIGSWQWYDKDGGKIAGPTGAEGEYWGYKDNGTYGKPDNWGKTGVTGVDFDF